MCAGCEQASLVSAPWGTSSAQATLCVQLCTEWCVSRGVGTQGEGRRELMRQFLNAIPLCLMLQAGLRLPLSACTPGLLPLRPTHPEQRMRTWGWRMWRTRWSSWPLAPPLLQVRLAAENPTLPCHFLLPIRNVLCELAPSQPILRSPNSKTNARVPPAVAPRRLLPAMAKTANRAADGLAAALHRPGGILPDPKQVGWGEVYGVRVASFSWVYVTQIRLNTVCPAAVDVLITAA